MRGGRFVATLALALLPACGGPSAPDGLLGQRAGLARNGTLWRSHALSSYRFRSQQGCFCAPPATQAVWVTVRGGVVTDVESVETGARLDPAGYAFYPTIDQRFALIRDALDDGADQVSVEYDAELGYPHSIYIDRSHEIADEEFTLEASELKRLGS